MENDNQEIIINVKKCVEYIVEDESFNKLSVKIQRIFKSSNFVFNNIYK